MKLTINDTVYDVDDRGQPLLYVLRDMLGLTGTKFGCGAGICGACTVHIDGVATRSCITPAVSVADKEITTIEGLSERDADGNVIALHPVQQAFVDHQVPQCAWCMSGQMMTASAFLQGNSAPSDDEIVEAMGNNYCRCGCYVRIKTAVADAAVRLAQAEKDGAA